MPTCKHNWQLIETRLVLDKDHFEYKYYADLIDLYQQQLTEEYEKPLIKSLFSDANWLYDRISFTRDEQLSVCRKEVLFLFCTHCLEQKQVDVKYD